MANSSQSGKFTVLYERLSRDDEIQGLSNSIVNQRELLQEYAESNGLIPFIHISDDGYSGTGWDRPGWQRILDEAGKNNIKCIIFKDLTRFGRDYLRVGLYMEMFRERGVRLIAINDGIDTDRGDDDLTPFRAIMAEWYARDTSRKIKSVFHKKGRDGKPMCHTPIYGFKKAPNEKDVWIIDEEAAEVVRRIFQMTVEGMGPYTIAKELSAEKVERPSYHIYQAGIQKTSGKCNLDLPYNWCGNVISKMLMQREYMGDLVNFKSCKPSFKSTKVIRNGPENRLVFEGALPSIVSGETWELAQKLRKTRRVPKESYPPNPLTGLVFCADCGGKMSNRRKTPDGAGQTRFLPSLDTYECSTYRNGKKRQIAKCSLHYISSVEIRKQILAAIRQVCAYAQEYAQDFERMVREASTILREDTAAANMKQIAENEQRVAELETLFRKAFEENAAGRLSDDRYMRLSGFYEREQLGLEAQNVELQSDLDNFHADNEKTGKFYKLIRRHNDLSELTTPMLHDFVDRVIVHEADRSSGERVQIVEVYLNFIGKFDVPPAEQPSQEEIDERERRLARKRKQQEYFRNRYASMKEANKRKAQEDNPKSA